MKKNKSKRSQRIFALVACVCLVCSMFVVSSSAADRIRSEDDVTLENFSGTTWIFNSSVERFVNYQNFSGNIAVSCDVNSLSYTHFYFISNEVVGQGGGFGYASGSGAVYTFSGGWLNDSYKTITFTSSIGEFSSSFNSYNKTAQDFLDWLKTNAELQVDPDPLEDLMDDSGDALTEILSELGDVAETIIDTPILLIMCIGLPVISFVVGLLARLKDRV